MGVTMVKCMKANKLMKQFEKQTIVVGRVGSPPLHKNGCYNLVANEGLGSTREFLGWSHRDT